LKFETGTEYEAGVVTARVSLAEDEELFGHKEETWLRVIKCI
jgi:hypothetical protein